MPLYFVIFNKCIRNGNYVFMLYFYVIKELEQICFNKGINCVLLLLNELFNFSDVPTNKHFCCHDNFREACLLNDNLCK